MNTSSGFDENQLNTYFYKEWYVPGLTPAVTQSAYLPSSNEQNWVVNVVLDNRDDDIHPLMGVGRGEIFARNGKESFLCAVIV